MIGAREFAAMQPHAYFITTARGFIHDEAALAEALRDKRIAGAGLDVWAKEPPPPDHPLLQFDNVLASPHTAGVTKEARENMGRIAAEQMLDALDGKRERLLDFAFLRNFSYGCKQVFSGERWALTGDAGLFLDPFYSPGSDFIAIANTYITELVGRDRRGRPLAAHAQLYDQIFHSFYVSTLALYTDQYPIFGDPEVLPVKVIWDYTYYWGILSQFFFQGRIADLAALSALRDELAHCQALNVEVQALLRTWSAARPADRAASGGRSRNSTRSSE